MGKLIDQPPSNKNKGNTSPVKTKTHIYPRKNRWGIVWSDTPASGSRRNIISKKLGDKMIEEFRDGQSSIQLEKKYKIDNDTILKYIKSKLKHQEFKKKKRVNQHDFSS